MKQLVFFFSLLFLCACQGFSVPPLVTIATPPAKPVARITTITTPLARPAAPNVNSADLPNSTLTPGDALDVTPADICVPGYSQKVRDVPESVKKQVYAEYGITSHKPHEYEVDHLISLELGGSNSVKNLWPESYSGDWNAHIKDKLENKLHQLVCKENLDLKTAQQAIASDWISAYEKYMSQ